MANILVTGGSGFIGTNLCLNLLNLEHTVFCIDNHYSSLKSNTHELYSKDKFNFLLHDIINPIDIDQDIDMVYHLACPASPVFYQKDELFTLDTCYIGTRNILEFARKKHARVLFTSTSEVYGDPLVHPQPESYFGNVNTLGPRSCYDEGKRVAESLLLTYHNKFNLDIRLVRIFNTYGPYMHPGDGRVVSNFIISCLQNKPVTIYGDGSQTRSFCYVSDMVSGLINTMELRDYNGPVNLGNPEEVTLLQLLDEIQNLAGTKISPIFSEPRVDDPVKRKPDISKAEKDLNWKPSVSLREGLNKAVEYYKNIVLIDIS